MFRLKNFVMKTGERYCLLIENSSGMPLYYPNLYLTTQVRNRSLSLASMEATLAGIAILLKFMLNRSDDIESRFKQRKYLEPFEIEALRDFCQSNQLSSRSSRVVKLKSHLQVSPQTVYLRITVISQYVSWLANHLLGTGKDKDTARRIKEMATGITARRPPKRNRSTIRECKGLGEAQLELLFEVFRPDSPLNPFKDPSVRVRNRLIFLLLYHFGIRGGELLNLRIRDIDFAANQIVVARRADEFDDPRLNQPKAKTRDRRLPIKDTLAREIHSYILRDRRSIILPGQPDYLLVTHKSGPTQGMPLSISGYKKILQVVSRISPVLCNFTGHQIRHVWNEKFSQLMDAMDNPPSEERQEEMRSYLMGWLPGSGTASIYNKRFIRKKGNEAALALQESQFRLPGEFE